MMRMPLEFAGRDPLQLLLNLQRRLARCETCSVADAKDMGINRDSRVPESGVEHDVCCLAANTCKLLKRVSLERDLTIMSLQELRCHLDEVLGLGVEEADRLYEVADFAFA